MVHVNDDDPTSAEVPPTTTPEPPYEALFPNLDKVSRSSFDKGTLSHRRIKIAAVVLVSAFVIVALAVALSVALS